MRADDPRTEGEPRDRPVVGHRHRLADSSTYAGRSRRRTSPGASTPTSWPATSAPRPGHARGSAPLPERRRSTGRPARPSLRAGREGVATVTSSAPRRVCRRRCRSTRPAAACASPPGCGGSRREPVGHLLRHRGDATRARDRRSRVAEVDPQRVGRGKPGSAATIGAPVIRARRPGRPAAGHAPRAGHLDARPGQVTSASRQTSRPRRSASRSAPSGLPAPVERDHLHAELLAVADEPVVEGLRAEPLGHGRHRHTGQAGPRPREVPVGHVRAARRSRRGPGPKPSRRGCSFVVTTVSTMRCSIHDGQPERLVPVAEVRPHRTLRRASPAPQAVRSGAARRRLRSSCRTPARAAGSTRSAAPSSSRSATGSGACRVIAQPTRKA